jgi:hypothetical protein
MEAAALRLPQAQLEQVLDRFAEVEARMGVASESGEIVRLGKEYAELRPVVDAVRSLARARAERVDLAEMAAADDAEMASLARDDLAALDERLPDLERNVALLLAPRDADENAAAILEVRAGTGGDEAALFAGDLFRMYQRYAQLRGWRVEVESVSEGEAGGYKEIIASIDGEGVFGRLKFESGSPTPRLKGASIPLPPRSPCCPRWRTWISRSRMAICASTPTAPAARGASMSTRPTPRFASPTCQAASSSRPRRNPSIRIAPGP